MESAGASDRIPGILVQKPAEPPAAAEATEVGDHGVIAGVPQSLDAAAPKEVGSPPFEPGMQQQHRAARLTGGREAQRRERFAAPGTFDEQLVVGPELGWRRPALDTAKPRREEPEERVRRAFAAPRGSRWSRHRSMDARSTIEAGIREISVGGRLITRLAVARRLVGTSGRGSRRMTRELPVRRNSEAGTKRRVSRRCPDEGGAG